ncbi:flagellar biosynthesis anti-sigma factor FlgM [Maridesulfovibrio zosterae]|uniref:flagellar biosynthesis anti-sigma factor FlgM n=1 Tax=Maridesulfovibrio zosterae TaxID=82171 RepID=UPI0003FF6677|nr:flagellar biosynthesis anti-sigma factor FlgM [Maridesulfovibrio zosterae]
MSFEKTNKNSSWKSCTPSSENSILEFDDENAERRQKLNELREQIRTGSYRPSIGEIAINLVRGTMPSNSFQ